MKPFWIGWYSTPAMGPWELHSPWWISGYRGLEEKPEPTICAAVMALDCNDAMDIVRRSYDKVPHTVEWRFCEERPEGWSPFCDRFPRAKWMQWS